jgi:hypothetical protein
MFLRVRPARFPRPRTRPGCATPASFARARAARWLWITKGCAAFRGKCRRMVQQGVRVSFRLRHQMTSGSGSIRNPELRTGLSSLRLCSCETLSDFFTELSCFATAPLLIPPREAPASASRFACFFVCAILAKDTHAENRQIYRRRALSGTQPPHPSTARNPG